MSVTRVDANAQPVDAPLSATMRAALADAAVRWDRSVLTDRRTWAALYRRGLVELHRGRATGRRGETLYGVIVDVKINAAGNAAIEALRP